MLKEYLPVAGLRLVSLLLAAAVVALVTAIVPAADFGRFNLMMSAAQIIVAASLSFPNLGLLRFARENFTIRGTVGEAVATRAVLHLVLLLFVVPAAWLSFPWIAEMIDVSPSVYPLLLAALLVISLSEMGTFAAQSVGSLVGYGTVQVLFRSIQVITLVAMYVAAMNSWTALLTGTLAGYGFGALVAWYHVPARTLRPFRPSFAMARHFASYSWSIPFAGLALVVINWMDLWFIRHFLGLEQVGVYAWAYNLSMAATALLAPLAALVGPRTIDLKTKGDFDELGRMISFSQGLFLLIAAMMPLGVAMFGFLVGLLPLGAYSGAVIPAVILIAAVAFQLGRNLWEPQVFSFENLVTRGTAIILIMGLVNAVGDWIFIPRMGISGAALATCAAYGVGALGMLTLIRRDFGQGSGPPLRVMALFSGVTLGAGLTATLLPQPLGYQLCALATPVLVILGRRAGLFQGLAFTKRMPEQEEDRLSYSFARALSWFAMAPREAAADSYARGRGEKINVLIVCPRLHVGGTERHLLQVLPSLDRNRFSVRIFTTRRGGRLDSDFEAAGIPVLASSRRLPPPLYTIPAFFSLIKVLLRDRPDIVHFFLPEAYLLGAIAAFLTGHSRLVMSRRSLNNYQARYPGGAWLEQRCHKGMAALLGNSQAVAKQLRDERGAPDRIGLIYNGIDLAPFRNVPAKEVVRRELGLAPESLVLTMVANFIDYKGHEDLLRALGRIRDELPADWTLLLAGRDRRGNSPLTNLRHLKTGSLPSLRWRVLGRFAHPGPRRQGRRHGEFNAYSDAKDRRDDHDWR